MAGRRERGRERPEELAAGARKARTVALDEATVKLLRTWKAHRGGLGLLLARQNAVVLADENGNRPHSKSVTDAFGSAVRHCPRDLHDVELPRITLHGLRHTAISHWREAGDPVTTVAERHGHTGAVMLSTYAHVFAGSRAAAAQKVADHVGAAGVAAA